ncbi:unnamed protein product [Ectocarpus sp. CCAP 1310/34]|nr:unnamed protein product [Ectocarpus sp. CCAP 1310/34]
MHRPVSHLLFCSRAFAQIKRYEPSQDALGEAKASEVLLEIVKAILHEFGLYPSDLAPGTTDSGSDVKSVSVNGLHPQFGVLWNWCFCHLMVKVAEDGFVTHVDPQKSKNPEARDMLKKLINLVGTLHRSANFKVKIDDLQVDVLGEVFDIPPLGEDGLPDRKDQKKALPHKMVAHDDLHPVAHKARNELCRALVTRFYGRVWDTSTLDPSVLCDAPCLLTPPFSEGNYVSAMKLTAEECEYLPAGSCVTAPTLDEEVKEKLDGAWTEIKKRAVAAVKTAQSRAAGGSEGGGGGPLKRARTSAAGPTRRKNREDAFAVFGRKEVAPQSSEGNLDLVEEEVSSEIMRYKGVFIESTDLSPSEALNYWKT